MRTSFQAISFVGTKSSGSHTYMLENTITLIHNIDESKTNDWEATTTRSTADAERLAASDSGNQHANHNGTTRQQNSAIHA